MSNENSDQYSPALLAWMRADQVSLIQEAPTRNGWDSDIVDRAMANMPAARDAWAHEIHRRKMAAFLAWPLIVFIVVSFAIALVSVFSNVAASLFALLGAGAAIVALFALYKVERAHYGRPNRG